MIWQSKNFNSIEVSPIFQHNYLRGNFKAGKTNINCRLGCDNVEDQTHIYYCDALKDEDSEDTLSYTDIYGTELSLKG